VASPVTILYVPLLLCGLKLHSTWACGARLRLSKEAQPPPERSSTGYRCTPTWRLPSAHTLLHGLAPPQVMAGVAQRSLEQLTHPFTFQSYHKRILEPYNYYEYGQAYVRCALGLWSGCCWLRWCWLGGLLAGWVW
jgi:hypothetical protein